MLQYKREPLMDEELTRFEAGAETFKERLVAYTLLDTGIRVAEFTGLTPDVVEWQHNSIIIFGKGGPFGKKTKRRVVPLSERVKTLLQAQFEGSTVIGLTPRTVQRIVKKIANKAKIGKPVHPHILRHTFAIKAVRKGVSLKALQLVMGHEKLETTNIYLNMSPEVALEEFKKKW